MAKIPVYPFLLLGRRSFAVAADNVKVQVQPAARKAATKEALPSANKEETFWMRDPKTGNWVPESHLGSDQVDAAEQREKLLPKKHRSV